MDFGFAMAIAIPFSLRTSHLLSSEGAGFVFKILRQVRFWVVSWSCFTELSRDHWFIYLSNVSLFIGAWAESLFCTLHPNTNILSYSVSQLLVFVYTHTQKLCACPQLLWAFHRAAAGAALPVFISLPAFLSFDWYVAALIHCGLLQVFLIVPTTSNDSHMNVHV